MGEERFGTIKGIAGGNFLLMGNIWRSALAEAAMKAIAGMPDVITSFADSIVGSGSKVGCANYRFPMPASTGFHSTDSSGRMCGFPAATVMKPNMKIIVIGIAIVLTIMSAGYLWFNIPQQPVCTINQIPGDVITTDKTMDNAVVCTNANNTVTFRIPLWDRGGGVWSLSNSSGLQVSEGIRDMPDRNMPEFGTIAWGCDNDCPGSAHLATITGVSGAALT